MVSIIRTRSMYNTRKVLYQAVGEVERINSVQIQQNDRKIESLANQIMMNTRHSCFTKYVGMLYSSMSEMMGSIDSDVKKALKHNSYTKDSYVLSIST